MSANCKTIVVKFGTSTLTHGSPKLNAPHMVDIVRQIAQLHQAGFRVVIVTSGAIAAGRHYLNHPQLPPTIASKQLLAAVGQSQLIQAWEKLFAIYDIHIGQILLTRADIEVCSKAILVKIQMQNLFLWLSKLLTIFVLLQAVAVQTLVLAG